MRRVAFSLGFLTLLAGCVNQPGGAPNSYFDFDSLVNQQIDHLLAINATIEKSAQIDATHDEASYQPDSTRWAHELEMFRDLNVINKPVNRNNYEVQGGVKDGNSNLLTKTLKAKRGGQVEQITFFYEGTPDKLRKIEALVNEETTLYSTARRLSMQFDNHEDDLLLSSYVIEGVQKIVLKDSVRFAIQVQVLLNNPHQQ